MKSHVWGFALLCAALSMTACGSESPLAPSSVPNGGNTHDSGLVNASVAPRLSLRDAEVCDGGVTYVGPIRQPISVHGTTVILSWLGSDCASRGYELEFERYTVANVWAFALRDIVTSPEAKEHLGTESTYRVRVRGLFTNDQVGGFTDWVVFSTDDSEDHTPSLPVIVIPPPPPGGGGDHGGHCEGDHNNDGHNDCGDNGNPPDNPGPPENPGGGNDNGNGNDNPGPPIDPPGNPGGGGPPVCVLTPTAHGDHPAPGGDHNDDGHNDCGVADDTHGNPN